MIYAVLLPKPKLNCLLMTPMSLFTVHGKNKALVVKQANQCISDLNCWFTANKLSINFDKTCYTVFGIGRTDKDIKINLAGTEIKRVLIDEELKWVENIDYIYNKVVKYIGIFYKLLNILPATVLQTIYFAFVHPHILYGIEMYGSASISHLDKLSKLNNKLLRILQRRDLCTLPVTKLYVMQILVFVHKFYYHKETLPEIFANYFPSNNLIHSYKPRNKIFIFSSLSI